jgi:hypothetical protein
MPVVSVVIGIFLGKWIEKRHENDKLKREIYLEANRSLSKYKDIYSATALNLNEENMQRLHEQQMLTESAKADLEIIGSDKAVELYVSCLECIRQAGENIIKEKQKEKTSVEIASNITRNASYKNLLNSWREWNHIVRKDLKIVKK